MQQKRIMNEAVAGVSCILQETGHILLRHACHPGSGLKWKQIRDSRSSGTTCPALTFMCLTACLSVCLCACPCVSCSCLLTVWCRWAVAVSHASRGARASAL
jgi:hypothetical protein